MRTLCLILLTVAMAGCQSPGKLVQTEDSLACPKCKNVTKTTPLAGVNYTSHTCSECGEEDTGVSDDGFMTEHHCTHCETHVGTCKQCQALK